VFHGVFFISLRGIAANHGLFSLATWHVFLSKEQKDKAECVLLFFCLKNVIKKYVFCPENSVKLCALRIEPVKMI